MPVFFVIKKDGAIEKVHNYSKKNKHVIRQKYA